MKTTTFYGLMEVSKELGVAYWKLIYAEQAGHIAEPMRIACKRAYTSEDVAKLKHYFLTKEGKKKS